MSAYICATREAGLFFHWAETSEGASRGCSADISPVLYSFAYAVLDVVRTSQFDGLNHLRAVVIDESGRLVSTKLESLHEVEVTCDVKLIPVRVASVVKLPRFRPKLPPSICGCLYRNRRIREQLSWSRAETNQLVLSSKSERRWSWSATSCARNWRKLS